ncbi:helix-turn-helix domain-containing protein [Vibrio parahaemolyticus]|uniref:helix-turn-helix domain-containing protein n=1 Tax=Vibrio parahaemolyticus TaxID=670 RepID=UPI0021D0A652|nr:helix-turn-helix domain-containing protein [Vibrio parahaemolyticus]MDL2014103.1 helix-turn-helix domain-containing protein [Vibrio parahaemolyticus]
MSFSHFKSPHGWRLDLILRARRLECGFYGALTIQKAKTLGKYQGRKPDLKLRENVALLLSEGKSWSQIQQLLGCSRSTIAKVKKQGNSDKDLIL